MRTIAPAVLLAAVTFVSPQNGSQVFGPMPIEVTTDAANVDRVEFHVDGRLAGVARKAPWRIAFDFGESEQSREIVAKVLSDGYRKSETARVITSALTVDDSITVDLVEVPMRVHAARMVKRGDLRLRENGVEQTIRDIRPQRGAAHFAFVLDRSLSMGDGRLAAALAAIDEARKLLRSDDKVSLILFNHTVSKARALGRGESAATVFGATTPSGGTSLRDAVASIPSRERTYAIVITDGGDRNSALSEEEALRRTSGTKTVVDALVLGTRSSFLDQAAKNTGGTIATADRDSVAAELRELIVDINSRYLLVYQSAGTKRGWRTIDIKTRASGVQVRNARRGYYAE